MLQWGRDQVIAEIQVIVEKVELTEALQWGRDQVIAEILDIWIEFTDEAACFNGAAIR